jgi:hypothetical protein
MTNPIAHETRESLSNQVRIFSGDQDPCKLCQPCVGLLDKKIGKRVNGFTQSAFFRTHVSPLLNLNPSNPTEALIVFTDKTITVETGSGNRSKKVTVSLDNNSVTKVFEGVEVTTNTTSSNAQPQVFAGGADAVQANQDILAKANAIWKGCKPLHSANHLGCSGHHHLGGSDQLDLFTDNSDSESDRLSLSKVPTPNLLNNTNKATNQNSTFGGSNPQLIQSNLENEQPELLHFSINETIPKTNDKNEKKKNVVPFGGQQLFPTNVTDEFNSKKKKKKNDGI